MSNERSRQFQEAARGLLAGDFSRLAPLFDSAADGSHCQITQWHEAGFFANEPRALDEAFTCACFLGRTEVTEYFLAQGINPSGGIATGLNAFHWAANRGQLEVVRLLIRHKAPLELRNSYGGTVLGATVWAAVHEPRPDHPRIVEVLLEAGARGGEGEYPLGDGGIDEILLLHG